MDTQHPTGRALYGPSVGVGGRGGRDDGGRGGRGDGGGRGRVVRVGFPLKHRSLQETSCTWNNPLKMHILGNLLTPQASSGWR